MLVQIKQGKHGTTRKYIRDNWYEWFVIEIDEGSYMPFYLPVERSILKRTTIAWVWYLIPIIIPMFLIKEIIIHVYIESLNLLNDWINYNK